MTAREHKLKALRIKYSGFVPQFEIDKLDGVAPAQVEAEVEIKKPRKLKVVEE